MSVQSIIDIKIKALAAEQKELEEKVRFMRARLDAIPHVGSELLKLRDELKAQEVNTADQS